MTKLLLNCSVLELTLSNYVTNYLMYICCQNPQSGLIEILLERNDIYLQEIEKYIHCVKKFPHLVSLFRKYEIKSESVGRPQKQNKQKNNIV